MIVLTLSHIDRGPLRVEVWDEASWWMKRRIWTCPDDPELGSFEDADFDEHYALPGQRIDDLLAQHLTEKISNGTTQTPPSLGASPPVNDRS